MNESLREGLKLSAMIGIILFVVITALSFVMHPMAIDHTYVSLNYRAFANWETKHSKTVDYLVDYCSIFKDEDQINCVVSYINNNYVGNQTQVDHPDGVRKVDELSNGYACRDLAVAYDAIFMRLGWETDFVFRPDHVYNHIWTEDLDCQINLWKYYCW